MELDEVFDLWESRRLGIDFTDADDDSLCQLADLFDRYLPNINADFNGRHTLIDFMTLMRDHYCWHIIIRSDMNKNEACACTMDYIEASEQFQYVLPYKQVLESCASEEDNGVLEVLDSIL